MKWIFIILGILLILGLIGFGLYFFFSGGSGNNSSATGQNTRRSSHEPLSVQDIVVNPEIYSSLQVSLEAPLYRWVTRRAFVIQDSSSSKSNNSLFGDDKTIHTILVIRKEQFDVPMKTPRGQLALGEEKVTVFVRGTVQELNISDLASRWRVNLNRDNLIQYNNQYVIIADEVRVK